MTKMISDYRRTGKVFGKWSLQILMTLTDIPKTRQFRSWGNRPISF